MALKKKFRTAVVLSGGGTRGAYEAGVIHYIRTGLPPKIAKNLKFDIHSGSSVGAINAAFMVALAHEPESQGRELVQLWQNIRTNNIYRRGPITLGKLLIRTFMGVGAHLINLKGWIEPDKDSLHFQGLFDTQPFFHFLLEHCPWTHISKNIESGLVDAISVSATNMYTGQIELFLEKRPEVPHSDRMLTRIGKLSPRHVMASAALPVLFPPVPIHGFYYNDGGVRLNTPIAPAVSLGATRILLIGTRYRPKRTETNPDIKVGSLKPPTLAGVLGKFFHAVLLDRLEADRDQLDRINRILASCAKHTNPEAFKAICEEAHVQPIETLSIFPSQDISKFVDEALRNSYRRFKSFGILERVILRLLEVDVERGSDLLTYFLFEPTYLKKLIDLGYEDARSHHHELVEFAEHAIEESNRTVKE